MTRRSSHPGDSSILPRVAHHDGWLDIDLSDLGITSLPLEFWQVLSRLQGFHVAWVDISKNALELDLTAVASVVGQFPYIEVRINADTDIGLN